MQHRGSQVRCKRLFSLNKHWAAKTENTPSLSHTHTHAQQVCVMSSDGWLLPMVEQLMLKQGKRLIAFLCAHSHVDWWNWTKWRRHIRRKPASEWQTSWLIGFGQSGRIKTNMLLCGSSCASVVSSLLCVGRVMLVLKLSRVPCAQRFLSLQPFEKKKMATDCRFWTFHCYQFRSFGFFL